MPETKEQKVDLSRDLELDFESDVDDLQEVGGESIDEEEFDITDDEQEQEKKESGKLQAEPDEDEEEEDIEAADEDEESDQQDEGSDESEARIIDEIATNLGYDFTEEELSEIPDTTEGVIDLVRKSGDKRANEVIDQWMQEHPMTAQVLDYERNGGDPQKFREVFAPEIDYSEVSIAEDDLAQQKNIIRKSLKEKGFSDEKIKRNIELYEDNGILKEEAEDSLAELQTVQENRKKELLKKQEKEREQIEKAQKEIVEQVQSTIKENNNFAGIPLPEAEKQKFVTFLTEEDEDGLTPRDRRAQEVTMEENLAFDLMLYYGFDKLQKLMKNRATSETSKSLKDRLDKPNPNSDGQDIQSTDEVDVDDLDFRI